MKEGIEKFVYWTPRILSILFIFFLAMFSLDVFTSEATVADIIVGLLMHNLPVFILVIVLWISWKREWFGGSAFILAGVLYVIAAFGNLNELGLSMWLLRSLIIAGPAFLIGALFLIGWFAKKK